MKASRAWLGALLGTTLLFVTASPIDAQQTIRAVGLVQWIAGSRMQLIMEDGSGLAVDLTEADQSSYRGLRNGEWVVVDGVVSPDRRRIIAQDIWRDNGRGAWSQSP